ncbi:hypothetical protein QBC39DRAFT_25884 [Podospora conica]|nr:hypothetical protein QBC39DRAFT_25884 [Schizothecium conicum]
MQRRRRLELQVATTLPRDDEPRYIKRTPRQLVEKTWGLTALYFSGEAGVVAPAFGLTSPHGVCFNRPGRIRFASGPGAGSRRSDQSPRGGCTGAPWMRDDGPTTPPTLPLIPPPSPALIPFGWNVRNTVEGWQTVFPGWCVEPHLVLSLFTTYLPTYLRGGTGLWNPVSFGADGRRSELYYPVVVVAKRPDMSCRSLTATTDTIQRF